MLATAVLARIGSRDALERIEYWPPLDGGVDFHGHGGAYSAVTARVKPRRALRIPKGRAAIAPSPLPA